MATEADRAALSGLKDQYKYGWNQPENYVFKARKGLDHDIVEQISRMKGEPDWMQVSPRLSRYLPGKTGTQVGSGFGKH